MQLYDYYIYDMMDMSLIHGAIAWSEKLVIIYTYMNCRWLNNDILFMASEMYIVTNDYVMMSLLSPLVLLSLNLEDTT